MARDPKVDHLADVRLFSGLPRRDLESIAKIADIVPMKAGTEIVRQGGVGHEFYLIVEGTATVERDGSAIATLGPGHYFGELALLAHAMRNATVVADTDIEAVVIGQREFATVLAEVPGVAATLLTTMAQRLSEADASAASH